MNYFPRYFFSCLAGLSSSLGLYLIMSFPGRWTFLIISAIWLAGLFFCHRFSQSGSEEKVWNLTLFFSSAISLLAFFLLLEWPAARWALIVISGLIIFFLLVRSPQSESAALSALKKPVRRLLMMLWVLNAFCLVTFIFALSTFSPGLPFWILNLAGGLVLAFISLPVWRHYLAASSAVFYFWVLVLGLAMLEVIWILHLLPLSFFVLGALAVWLWYLAQLLIRFHLSPQGIIWSRQWRFLAGNLILWTILLVFVARWT